MVTVLALFLALTVSGLSLFLLLESGAARKVHARLDDNLRALEAAETGLVRSEQELCALQDAGTDGLGNVTGTHAGSSYSVTAVADPVVRERWTLRAVGRHGLSQRTIEACTARVHTGPWAFPLCAEESVTLTGGKTLVDSYDSRAGTYASQATNHDGVGPFAGTKGSIAANSGSITMSGSARVHGDARAGPGFTLKKTGGSTVYGSEQPLKYKMSIPPPPLSSFVTAFNTNDNGAWTSTGGVNYDPVRRELSVKGGTLTLTGSRYFFTNLNLSSGAVIRVAGGPVQVYVTGTLNLDGGSIAAVSGRPYDAQLIAYPYALPAGFAPPSPQLVRLAGGSGPYVCTIYAPRADVRMSGGSELFGAVVGRTITETGGAKIHYDEALGDQYMLPHKVVRILWRELNPPAR